MSYRGPGLPVRLHVVALVQSVRLATGDDAISIDQPTGLYTFTNKRDAQSFVTACNSAVFDETAAFLFEGKKAD